ncbi:MAG: Do family serine endopeptidase [Bacteroidia bacterium]|nr:Do family serine endopeptidase [Bacteroidia bacterium]
MNRQLKSWFERMQIDPRQLAMLGAAAVLGSGLTLGTVSLINRKSPVLRIEHSSGAQAVQSSYVPAEGVPDFVVAAEKVTPSVVHIKSTQVRASASQNNSVPDPFREFFGDDFFNFRSPGPQGPSVGTGSGVILTEDGYIITNNHVIDKADDIEVSLFDNRTFKAELVGTDPSTDLALIKVDASGLVPVTIGNSDEVRVGQWVLAIGNPFNLTSTVTAGIVSAKARNINILRERTAIESFIQTDAAINPGNSGGALVDLNGNLIGINTAIASNTGTFAGYGFAVPIRLARKVVEDLMQYGVVQRGYLGVTIRSLDGNLAKEKGLRQTEGVLIDSVGRGSAAADAGIRAGDVVTAVNGKTVRSASELQAIVGAQRPGDKVTLSVSRDGSSREVAVTLKNQAGNTDVVKREAGSLESILGAEFEALTPQEAKRNGVDGGVRVTRITGSGKLARTDMRPGFIITHVEDKPVKSVDDLRNLLGSRQGGVMVEGVYEGAAGSYYYAFGM